MLLSLKDFRGKSIVKGLFTTLIGLPTVALGLLLWLILSKAGPLGFLGLLYTPGAIILGEALLVTPLMVSIATNAIEAVDPEMMNLAKTLGASESQASIAVLKEAINGIIFSDVAGFNRAIAELGVALMVGGNLAGFTDVLTTATSSYTAQRRLLHGHCALHNSARDSFWHKLNNSHRQKPSSAPHPRQNASIKA